jgi:hypothetical protein
MIPGEFLLYETEGGKNPSRMPVCRRYVLADASADGGTASGKNTHHQRTSKNHLCRWRTTTRGNY